MPEDPNMTTDNILNKNRTETDGDTVIKQSASEKGTLAESLALTYLESQHLLQVPSPVHYDEEQHSLEIPFIKGVLLLKLMRNLSTYAKTGLIPQDQYEAVNIRLLDQMLSDLAVFQEHSQDLMQILPPEIIEPYSYTHNLQTAITILAQYCDIQIGTDSKVTLEADTIAKYLESHRTILYRDAGLYNQMVELPEGMSAEDWLIPLFANETSEDIFKAIYARIYHLDFETCYRLVCPEDDQSFILGSSVNTHLALIHEDQRHNEIFYFATIFRNLRVAARHIQYLFNEPDTYYRRYTHYGSLEEESPIYYLQVVIRAFAEMERNGVTIITSQIRNFAISALHKLQQMELPFGLK